MFKFVYYISYVNLGNVIVSKNISIYEVVIKMVLVVFIILEKKILKVFVIFFFFEVMFYV